MWMPGACEKIYCGCKLNYETIRSGITLEVLNRRESYSRVGSGPASSGKLYYTKPDACSVQGCKSPCASR